MLIKLQKILILVISTLAMTTACTGISQAKTITSVKVVEPVKLKNFLQVNKILNEYQYEIDGWDGSSKDVIKDADQRLLENLNSLVSSGVSLDEIQLVMENRITNPAKKAEYRQLVESLKILNVSNATIKAIFAFMSEPSATHCSFP